MTRTLALTLTVLLSACQIPLEPRSYACDPFLTDGGVQCTEGWSCGLDNKCFNRSPDAGLTAWNWQCEDAGHCPIHWQCGVRIADAGYCQLLDAGYPSQCLDSTHCQGGWRCGAEQRCFDPGIPDAGATRRCTTTDGGNDECPFGFRCGQRVGTDQFCIELDAGAASLCTTDDGCEGGLRCDTVVQRCVEVPDVIDPGALTNLQPAVLSPLRPTPVPRLVAVSRFTVLPPALLDGPTMNQTRGFVLATLFDGGVWVDGYNLERGRSVDGGRQAAIASQFLPTDLPNAEELVVTASRVVLRAGTTLRTLTYGPQGLISSSDRTVPPTARVRALTSLREGDVPQDYVVLGVAPGVAEAADGGTLFTVSGAGPLLEYVEPNTLGYVVDANGRAFLRPTPGGAWEPLTDAGFPAGLNSTQLVTGTFGGVPALLLEVSTPMGRRVVPYLPPGPTPDLRTDPTAQTFDVCPTGARLLQLSYALQPMETRGGAAARCSLPDAGVVSVLSRWQLSSPDSPWRVQLQQFPDDLVPWTRPVVVARTSPLMRAHAGANGRLWFTPDLTSTGFGNQGSQPLMPVVLDRQPDTVVKVDVLGGTIATSGNRIFQTDSRLGLVGSFDQNPFTLLGLFADRPSWLVTNLGVLNLDTVTDNGSPTEFARVTGAELTAPISGFSTTAVIDGVPRLVALIASGDSVWAADVTDSSQSSFVTPSALSPVFVPQPGVRLRSLTLVPPSPSDAGTSAGVRGFITTATSVLQFDTDDLVRWKLTAINSPAGSALPIEVWNENGRGRVGTRDGTIWSLPIQVALSKPLSARDGGVLQVDDFARTCGAQFATTREGLFTLTSTSGLPEWAPVSDINDELDSFLSLKLYETAGRLYVATQSGQVVEVRATGACP